VIPSFVIFAIARAPDAAGLPFEIGERGIGHKPRGIAGRYINLSDDQIREGFREMFERMATRWQQEKAGPRSRNVDVL
jgi:hypothetical protein